MFVTVFFVLTDFTLWFLGQLLRMLSSDKFSYAHKLSLDAQSTLLSICADKSIEMLRRIMQEYTKFISGEICLRIKINCIKFYLHFFILLYGV